jgi:hypothetical protein
VATPYGISLLNQGGNLPAARQKKRPPYYRQAPSEHRISNPSCSPVWNNGGRLITRGVGITSGFFILSIMLFSSACFLIVGTSSVAFAGNSSKEPRVLGLPAETVVSVIEVLETGDGKKITSIFETKKSLKDGDKAGERIKFDNFIRTNEEDNTVVPEPAEEADLHTGKDYRPLPFVNKRSSWLFDVNAGKEETIKRRIGKNERNAIDMLLGYADSRRTYAGKDHDGDDILEYARKSASAKGNSNGPYQGYFYKAITSWRPDIHDHVLKDKTLPGFAAIAWPANYGFSGIMTFVITQAGVVYKKDLGPETGRIAVSLDRYDPDTTWLKVEKQHHKVANRPKRKSDN